MKKVTIALGAMSMLFMAACGPNMQTINNATTTAESAAQRAQADAQSADQAATTATQAASQADAAAQGAQDSVTRANDAVAKMEAAFSSSVTK